jgi:hypothetical protein
MNDMNDNILNSLYTPFQNMYNPGDEVSQLNNSILSRVDLVKNNNQSINNINDFNFYKNKSEHANLLPLECNIQNINTNMFNEEDIKETYNVSSYQTNVNPNDLQFVGPGINKGFIDQPSGGYNQGINIIPYILPKTVDELRTVNNPKLVNEGRLLMGNSISKVGLEGEVSQHKPDTYYINEFNRWLKTTGAIKKQKIQPKLIVKDTNRIVSMELKGNLHSKQLVKSTVKSNVALSRKNIYKEKNIGPAKSSNPRVNNYNKNSFRNVPNERQNTESKTNILNVQSINKKLKVYDPNCVLKTTIKETNILNESSGFLKGPNSKLQVYDPDDVARTTIKETNIINNNSGNMQVVGPNKLQTYDPNDVARTTIKETNIINNNSGNMQVVGPNKLQTYDPNDVARTTIKETNIINNNSGNMQVVGPNKLQTYDPNDVARTTIKETNILNNNSGNMQVVGPSKLQTYDPNDVARTTIKETNILNDHLGGVNREKINGGYMTNKQYAPTTLRETLENINTNINCQVSVKKSKVYDPDQHLKTTTKQTTLYSNVVGNVSGGSNTTGGCGYLTNKKEARNTNRQYSHQEYMGTGNSSYKKDMENKYKNMRVNESKQSTLVSRKPTKQSVKLSNNNVNINIRKVESDFINKRINHKNKIQTIPLYNGINTFTNSKIYLDDRKLMNDRINPYVVSSLQTNPYTI